MHFTNDNYGSANSSNLSQYTSAYYTNNFINYISYPISPSVCCLENAGTEVNANYFWNANYESLRKGFQQNQEQNVSSNYFLETGCSSAHQCGRIYQENKADINEDGNLDNAESPSNTECFEAHLLNNWNQLENSSLKSFDCAAQEKELSMSCYNDDIAHFSDDSGKLNKTKNVYVLCDHHKFLNSQI